MVAGRKSPLHRGEGQEWSTPGPPIFPVGALTNSLQMAINGIRRERSAAFGRKDEAAIEELSAKPARP